MVTARTRLRRVNALVRVLLRAAACTSVLTGISCSGSPKVDRNDDRRPPIPVFDPEPPYDGPIPEYGPHTVDILMFHVGGADKRQRQAAREMAEQKRRELLECYRKVPSQRYMGPGAPRYQPAGTFALSFDTEPDGTMLVPDYFRKFTSEELNECVRRAFDRQPSSFPAMSVTVEYRFDRPLLDERDDAAGPRPSR